MSMRYVDTGAVVTSQDLIDAAPQKPKGKRPGVGDTTKTYPTSGDVIRKGKRR